MFSRFARNTLPALSLLLPDSKIRDAKDSSQHKFNHPNLPNTSPSDVSFKSFSQNHTFKTHPLNHNKDHSIHKSGSSTVYITPFLSSSPSNSPFNFQTVDIDHYSPKTTDKPVEVRIIPYQSTSSAKMSSSNPKSKAPTNPEIPIVQSTISTVKSGPIPYVKPKTTIESQSILPQAVKKKLNETDEGKKFLKNYQINPKIPPNRSLIRELSTFKEGKVFLLNYNPKILKLPFLSPEDQQILSSFDIGRQYLKQFNEALLNNTELPYPSVSLRKILSSGNQQLLKFFIDNPFIPNPAIKRKDVSSIPSNHQTANGTGTKTETEQFPSIKTQILNSRSNNKITDFSNNNITDISNNNIYRTIINYICEPLTKIFNMFF